MGRYFEALIETVFLSRSDIEALHTNVPVRDGKTTKGEFDLLYKQDGKWRHLEMTIKFYLGVGNRSDAFNWHGPALRDNLGRKLDRMVRHQLTLPDTVAGRATLQALNINSIESEPLVLGRLFHPYADWQQQKPQTPKMIAPDHTSGWWLYAEDMDNLSFGPDIYWQALRKADWLAPASSLNSQRHPQPDFFNISQPMQFAALDASDDGTFHELSRGFVVPVGWGPQSKAG